MFVTVRPNIVELSGRRKKKNMKKKKKKNKKKKTTPETIRQLVLRTGCLMMDTDHADSHSSIIDNVRFRPSTTEPRN